MEILIPGINIFILRWGPEKVQQYRDRLFDIDSVSTLRMLSPSSPSGCSFVKFIKILCVDLMRCSHPPWWKPPGGLNVHWMFLHGKVSAIFAWFQLLIHSIRSRWAPPKLVLLSEQMTMTCPRLPINWRKQFRNASVSNDFCHFDVYGP